MTSFNWKIAGAAGEGIKVAGLIFSKTCFHHGFYVHGYTEYPSLIRGGHNTFQVCFGQKEQLAPRIKLNLLVCLNQESLKLHLSELTPETLVLSETKSGLKTGKLLNLPLVQLVKQIKGPTQMINLIALGASSFLLGLKLEVLKQEIKTVFSKKGSAIIELNQKAAQVGYDYAQKNFKNWQVKVQTQLSKKPASLYLSGNEAIALGALAGGLKFYTAYPMTPVTSILHYLAETAKNTKILVRHAEDEIGAINSAIGASFAGARSVVATSGGGFSLMTEALGLAGVTETPIVVINGMRPGPASGMPTWGGQGDLLFVINAAQDEFPRLVLSPGDPGEAFELTKLALNLAEKYQLPVIILSDKYLSESFFTTPTFAKAHQNQRFSLAKTNDLPLDQPFRRYQVTQDGVSPRSLPGQPGGVHLANSYEHDQLGYATEDPIERTEQVNKRNQKLVSLLHDPDLPCPRLFGPAKAKTSLISWGSNKGAILQALPELPETNFIHLPLVWPFPKTKFLSLLKNTNNLISLEANSTGQLKRLIRQQTGLEIKKQLLKYDGRPFYPEEIIEKIRIIRN